MKSNIIIKGFAGLLATAAIATSMTSCKDDYLDLTPITDASASTVSSSLVGAHAAMVGLCNGMYRDCDYGFNGPNGEPWLLTFFAEAKGNACLQGLWTLSSMGTNYVNWRYLNENAAVYPAYMWRYCYNLIDDANNLLAIVEDMEVADEEIDEKDFIEAVALTIRAHGYIRLLQTYAPRWDDSNNGSAYCVILRTEPSTVENVNKDFSTMGEVLAQIYSDLDDAIDIFENSSYSRGNSVWMPNEDVARGLYARAAMLKNDYATAIEMAEAAMAGYPLMSADEYRSGFVYANSEYLWATDLEAQDVGQYCWGNWQAFNGQYTGRFGLGDSMDYTLYKNLAMTDCRKYLYFMPELMELIPEFAATFGITPEDFFISIDNGGIADPDNMVIWADGGASIPDFGGYDAYYMANYYALGWMEEFGSALVNYDESLTDPYTYIDPRFGLGFKFWGEGNYAYNNFPFMRASELGYYVAEAQYMLGNTTAAQEMMNYLNKGVRDPEYDCTLTGEELLAHIKAYREIELWDEGFNWFDMKRWGDDLIRNVWEEGNPESGNWGADAASYTASEFAGWRYQVPETEFLYNKGADPLKVQY
ncbi:MAG: RagB/SusD family nutrient uptake outer membrane protein [Muribaculaceae bacterium]|nr:RagB/SusD family nutrient uptake outer membrane protein [Muribaculaceae bacterium]